MKKFFAIILVLATTSYSKSYSQDKIYGGFKLAPNYSVFLDKAGDNKSGVGYGISYFEVLELSNKINLQAEFGFTNMSFDYQPTGQPKTTTNFQSLDLPFMIKYRLSDNFAIGLGYQFDLLGGGSKDLTDPSLGSSDPTSDGLFLDMNTKTGKTIIGLRVLKTNNNYIENVKSLNASFYIGFGIF